MSAPAMISGRGKFHTNSPEAKNPKPLDLITWADIVAMVDDPQHVAKDNAQWLIASTLPSRKFSDQEERGEYWLLWADLDKEPPSLDRVVDVLTLEIVGAADFEVFSSRSATVDCPKARILIPLDQPLRGADWVLAQEVLNDELQAAGITPDRVSEGAAQVCYLPNVGAHFEKASQRDGIRFRPLESWADKIESKRQALVEKAREVEVARKAAAERKAARAALPSTVGRPSLIEAFCEAYSVADILLQAGYRQRGDTFCHPGSESGSYSASVKDGRVHSLSTNDPLYTDGGGVGAHDAFSAFEVLMHGGNRTAALKDAGDNWLTIGAEPWNKVEQREWAQRNAGEQFTPSHPDNGAALHHCGQDDRPPFVRVPIADLAHTQPPAPSFWWDGYMPAGVVTLWAAHGATGKSTFALMLTVAIGWGIPLFGVPTRHGRVAFFSGEDNADTIRHRMYWICRGLEVDPADLDDRVHILDATAGDPTLFHEVGVGGRRQGVTTPSYEALRQYIDQHQIDVLIVDNASDAFDASEIDRAKVRGFMRALARIAQERMGAVMLLAHVDKGTSRGERSGSEGYSGSTAWHNSARSRLFLSRDKDDRLVLEHQKANFSRQAEPLHLIWPEGGLPHVDQPMGGFVQHIADGTDTKALLKLIHEFYERGEYIATDNRSRYHAVKVLGGESTYPKRRKPADVFKLLRDAERRELIRREVYKDRNRKEHERWQLTIAGVHSVGVPAPSAPCAPSTEHGAHDHTAQQGAPSAPCGVQGVWGNGARAMAEEMGAEA